MSSNITLEGLRAGRSCAYLRGADMRGADMRGADLWSTDLEGADMRGADLRGADLSYAYLWGANLRGADMRGADLSCAVLSCADLSCADLWGANLRGAKLKGATGLPWYCYGGSAHFGWMPSSDRIQIGCERHTIAYWLAHYAAIGAANGYTPEQIEEYGAWIRSVAERTTEAREEQGR